MSSKNDGSHSFQGDNISYITISSRNRELNTNNLERQERLHEWLKSEEIQALHEVFRQQPMHLLNYSELRQQLERLNISFSDMEYNRLFLKINQNRDFKVDWNEFVSYLIYGFQEDDPSKEKESLILPISTPPLIKKSEHRSPICSITLLQTSIDEKDPMEDEPSNVANGENAPTESTGMWLTASREGQIRFWTNSLEPIRTGMSESIHIKMSTWILAIQALSDVCIVCTSSTERELRFHETMATTFALRLVIRSMPFAVCTMSYSYHPKGNTPSKLILGDYGGHIRILEFSPFLRGPFQSKPGAAFVDVYWTDVLKGKLPLLRPKELINFHTEMIQQVGYSMRMNALFVAAEYRNTKKYRGRCPGLVALGSGDEKTTFRIPLGVTTFFLDERHNIVVTGGPDMYVRIWDVYIAHQPSGILTGHNGGIVMVFVQSEIEKVYSIDYQKVIKVWHLTEHTLLQSYGDLVHLIPATEVELCYRYNAASRELIVGGRKLISIKCNPRIRVDLTDGNTHAAPVSVVLYNNLFRNLVTCGLDSYIIVWDPWLGRRQLIMKSCHTKMVYGEITDIEITAACFDPLEQFLLTGARDGSLKIWNYNNAVCVRNMSIRPEHEVTAVIWVVERILAVGWDQQVTEFNDAEGREYSDAKKWPRFHTDDITCADVKLGEGVVTATYSGEIIFWKLETGQPYRRYSVADPTKFIELKYNKIEEPSVRGPSKVSGHINVSRFVRKSISANIHAMQERLHMDMDHTSHIHHSLTDEIELEERSVEQARNLQRLIPLSVQAVLFLQTRPMTKEHGSVLVSLDTGIIQTYTHHQRGGYLAQFNSIHKTGDCVLAMATDRKNRYLFTGTAFGYIKIWNIQNYCVPGDEKVHVSMPLLRLQFIFLRKERFLTRAKRVTRHQPEPLLLSSYKGHLKAVTSIVYINLPKILITGSYDFSCRLWSLGGRYLGTLGTPLLWQRLSPFEPADETKFSRMPPDIKKVASSTTMKVVTGIQEEVTILSTKKCDAVGYTEADGSGAMENEVTNRTYGQPLREPILGKHFELPGRSAAEQRIELDSSQPGHIPVFTHLKIHDAKDIIRPASPQIIRRIGNEQYMQFYEPKDDEIENDNKINLQNNIGGAGIADCNASHGNQKPKKNEIKTIENPNS